MDNEINYEDVFGISAEENNNTDSEDVNDQTSDATQGEEGAETGAAAPENSSEAAEGKEQDADERARQAAGRRIREREAAARQEERAKVSELLKRLGIEDADGRTIDSVDALEEYEKTLRDRRLASGRGTADDIKRIVKDAIREETQPEASGKNSQADSVIIQNELRQIHGMDPDINELADILKGPHAEAFRDYVDKGLNFVDAYTLAAKSKLDGIRAARVSSAEKSKAAGKSHLSSTPQRGEGQVPVPPEELELFKRLNPKATDAEIQRYYNDDRRRFRTK